MWVMGSPVVSAFLLNGLWQQGMAGETKLG